MLVVIPTWEVVVRGMGTFRVLETNLDQFLHVLTFNKREFDVRKIEMQAADELTEYDALFDAMENGITTPPPRVVARGVATLKRVDDA